MNFFFNSAKIILMVLCMNAAIAQTPKQNIEANSSLGTLKQINAGLLNVGYTEAGTSNGTPVILLHGWPYDIHSYNEVVPILVSKGYHVFTPYLRGFGTTTFLSKETFRNGQQAALASDVIAFMDALKIDKAVVGGFGKRGIDARGAVPDAPFPARAKT